METLPVDKRREPRKIPYKETKLQVLISLPFPRGLKLKKEIVDLSPRGLSFKLNPREGSFLPGTPLKEITIFDKSESFKTSGKVVYVEEIKEGKARFYRIGIGFPKKTFPRQLSNDQSRGQQIRPTRYEAEEIGELRKLIIFEDEEGSEITGSIINFSKYGVAFQFTDVEAYPRISDKLKNFKIFIEEESVFSGEATVTNIKEEKNRTTIGVSLRGSWLDVEKIFHLKRRVDVESEITDFLNNLSSRIQISEKFKAVVGDLRFLLENIKKKFAEEEKNFESQSNESRAVIESHLLDVVDSKLKEKFDKYFMEIEEDTKDLPQEKHEAYKNYFQHHLHYLFFESPFANRIYAKPLGYAGDFEVINMLLRNSDGGGSLFSRLINRYICNLPVAKAHRGRSEFLYSELGEIAKKVLSRKERVRILDVGCGPAAEIIKFIKNDEQSNQCDFTLIDFDPESLYYCQEEINKITAVRPNTVKVETINQSVRDLIKDSWDRGKFQKKYDFIYCAGLYDYLTVPACTRLTQVLFKKLNPGGALIVTNVTENNKFKRFMEYGGEWYVFHRTNKDMEKIVSGVAKNAQPEIVYDETGTNIFMRLKS